MGFTFKPYQLEGLLVVEGSFFPDERGVFMESFRENELRKAGIPPLVQDNLSRSQKGVLRGMHYQIKPSPVGKLVRCVRGKILDVVVDIRKKSPTYGKWASIELGDEGNRMFWVPEGFAHGFYTLSETADVLYKVSGYWAPEVDRGILWNDPAVGIRWPSDDIRVSPKDAKLPPLSQADNNF
ncbi:MAG: dTDP-4-dehydrorhamnose 3,5-epimerase [Elusimicrobia bacterium RIFCSPHIGHO2_02_FULL_57_9]|nr:MAG: dTDP-4-dehydrorhamnose 3,5-epimerase [Elusimicrobia bacterium RIFCSPHIGHO2_02_FULL_57_9]